MKGKTFTKQDLALGSIVLQSMPLASILPAEKQRLIEDKSLLADLLSFCFTQTDLIPDSSERIEVWSSESEQKDRFADDNEIDAMELILELKFDGLKPKVRPVLEFVRGVYLGRREVVQTATIEEWTDSEFTDEFDDLWKNMSISISTDNLANVSIGLLFRNICGQFKAKLSALSLIRLETTGLGLYGEPIGAGEYEFTIGKDDFTYTTRFVKD